MVDPKPEQVKAGDEVLKIRDLAERLGVPNGVVIDCDEEDCSNLEDYLGFLSRVGDKARSKIQKIDDEHPRSRRRLG